MDDLAAALFDAWATIKPVLRRDQDELRARLARRRRAMLVRPPRACCLAVRANDTRINPATAAIVPEDAAYPGHDRDYAEHAVVLDARLLRMLCRPVYLEPLANDSGEAARALGTTQGSLAYAMRHGKFRVERKWGLAGRRVDVPLVWRNDPACDPGSSNAFERPDEVWGSVWPYLPDRVPDDFEQLVRRRPAHRDYPGRGRQFRGWRWLCPGCGQAVRTVFYPLPIQTITEYLRDEPWLAPERADADAAPAPPPCFACHRCHRVRYWSRAAHVEKAWNQLVAYLSGGLLYGREVERPASFAPRRRRAYRPHRAPHARGDEVMRLLVAGRTYAQVAAEVGVALATVQGHVRRMYKRLGVHSRAELVARIGAGAMDADPAPGAESGP